MRDRAMVSKDHLQETWKLHMESNGHVTDDGKRPQKVKVMTPKSTNLVRYGRFIIDYQ